MGIWQLSWKMWFVVAFFLTHITILSVTLHLHRAQAHRALDLHPVLTHFFRLWVWLTTGMNTREWVAVHRKHHAYVETEQDPHSPKIYGIWTVLFRGVSLYRKAAASKEILEKYGQGTPDDWLENNVYAIKNLGVLLALGIDVICFGAKGLLLWAVQMLWIPLLAAGVINGIGHYIGYRNYEPVDQSTNIIPWGIFIGGEELHNNHHAYPRSARFSARWFEFDLGYAYIRLLCFFRLAKVRYVLPDLKKESLLGVSGILNARMSIYREYQVRVLKQVISSLRQRFKSELSGYRVLMLSPSLLKEADHKRLTKVLSLDKRLETVYQFQLRLYKIFYEKKQTGRLLISIRQWCEEAKSSQEELLQEFAKWVEFKFLTGVQ